MLFFRRWTERISPDEAVRRTKAGDAVLVDVRERVAPAAAEVAPRRASRRPIMGQCGAGPGPGYGTDTRSTRRCLPAVLPADRAQQTGHIFRNRAR
jgi:hypothetical protein